MKVGEARALTAEWVMANAGHIPSFLGAYYSGSSVGMPDDAELPPTSDIDVIVVTMGDAPPKPGKFPYKGALVEVTYIPWAQYSRVEDVLTDYHLATSLRMDTVVDDPTGGLRRLQTMVSRHFAEPEWVRKRYEALLHRIGNRLMSIDYTVPMPEVVMSWLFPTGMTAHVPLVAALRNPTVRLRYPAARQVLVEHGFSGLYPKLLGLLGCRTLAPDNVERHLSWLSRIFDAAVSVAKTPFPYSSDITANARHIAIDGSRMMVRDGDHREAMFWMAVTFARCHAILHADAPKGIRDEHMPAFLDILADLGIHSYDDMRDRSKVVLKFIPMLRELAEGIMAANQDRP